jgi:hypothetical protein
MKIFSKKNVSILSILVTGILFGISSYYAFNKYQSSQKIKHNLEKRVEFNNLNFLIKSIEKEKLRSAIYLSKTSSSSLKKLNELRKEVNSKIQKIKTSNLIFISKELISVRKSVNLGKENYLVILSEMYQKKLLTLLY